ncbi:MAG: hypothetical protein HAW67_05780 [Endozoicomonadaceae bacterium]|nr:hypothetical protein [Endozoicomonadaceae bacterium]
MKAFSDEDSHLFAPFLESLRPAFYRAYTATDSKKVNELYLLDFEKSLKQALSHSYTDAILPELKNIFTKSGFSDFKRKFTRYRYEQSSKVLRVEARTYDKLLQLMIIHKLEKIEQSIEYLIDGDYRVASTAFQLTLQQEELDPLRGEKYFRTFASVSNSPTLHMLKHIIESSLESGFEAGLKRRKYSHEVMTEIKNDNGLLSILRAQMKAVNDE